MAENKNKSQLTAEVQNVLIGYLEVEGMLLSNGEFGLTSKQACMLLLDTEIKSRYKDKLTELAVSKVGQKYIPQGLEFDGKVRIKDTSNKGTPYVDVLRLTCFEKLIRIAEKLGNEKAANLTDLLIGLSLHQLFSDAFGQKFDAEDRQQWLKTRTEGKLARRSLTDAIKQYLDTNDVPKEKRATVYANVTDKIYLGLFGCRAKAIKEKLQTTVTRDELDNIHLRHIEHAEAMVMRLIDFELLEPLQAVDEALNRLIIPTQKL